MKKITLLLFVALFALNSFGQTEQRRVALGLGAGTYFTHSKNLLTESTDWDKIHFTPEAYLSFFLSNSFDLYFKSNFGYKPFFYPSGSSNTNGTKNDWIDLALNLRYKLANDKLFAANSKLQPYIFAGPTHLWDNDESGFSFNAGLGFKHPLNDWASLYLDGAYVHGIKGTYKNQVNTKGLMDNHFKVTLGIEFAFLDNDKDNDGVKNKVDDCPDTPGLAKFRGCPDTDGDGVPDPKDECPGTPEKCWSTVDAKGCPKDSDGDGIIDCEDDCPNAAGPKEFKGCPDTDGDGVIDKNDECPNTPKGCKVDAKGCPLDRDKDGVIDCQDDCPDEFGVKELKGCPIRCKDFEINNVQFDFDKADLKPAGIATLDEFVAKLNEQSCKEFDVLVNGHTCSIGGKNYNMTLSEKRAQAVVKYLISKGVNVAFVTGKGYGETEPAVPNTNKTNRETNRRAVVDLIIK